MGGNGYVNFIHYTNPFTAYMNDKTEFCKLFMYKYIYNKNNIFS